MQGDAENSSKHSSIAAVEIVGKWNRLFMRFNDSLMKFPSDLNKRSSIGVGGNKAW